MNKAQAYLRHQDSYVLVERHAPLVKRIAQHLLARLPSSVLLDDLIQAGMIGLLEASRNFDGSKGASFETYAGIRIRGAMLDEILARFFHQGFDVRASLASTAGAAWAG